ncbi:MAG: DUF87 domain-containing protein [Candidatus Anstonellales archaeon]
MTFVNNTGISHKRYGLELTTGSQNNTFINNVFISNYSFGAYLASSEQNTLTNNTIKSVYGQAYASPYSKSNRIANNTIISEYNISINLTSTNSSIFENNTISSPTLCFGLFLSNQNSLVSNQLSACTIYINGTTQTSNSSFNIIENNTGVSIINLTAYTYNNFGCQNEGATIIDDGDNNSVYPSCSPSISFNLTPKFVVKGANVSVVGRAEFGGAGIKNKPITIYFNGTQISDNDLSPPGPPSTNSTGWFNYTFNVTNASWLFGIPLYESGQYNVSVNFTDLGRSANRTENMTVFEFYPSIRTNKSHFKSSDPINISIVIFTDVSNYPYADASALSLCISNAESPENCSIAVLSARKASTGNYSNETDIASSLSEGNYSAYTNLSVQGILRSNSTTFIIDNTPPYIENLTTTGLNVFNYTSPQSTYTVYINVTDNRGISSVLCEQAGINISANFTGGGSNAWSCSLAAPPLNKNYNITIFALDNAGNVNSTGFELSTLGFTNLTMLPQVGQLTPITINDLHAGYYVIYNITLNNTGNAKAHRANVSMTHAVSPQYVTTTTSTENCTQSINYGGGSCTVSFNVTVNAQAPQATYYLYFRSNFTNNNLSIGTTSEKYLAVTVTGNPILTSADYNTTINHSTTGRFNLSLNSTGNDNVRSVSVSYIPNTLPSSWVAFAPEAFVSIDVGSSENVSVNITVPTYTLPGNYTGHFDVNTSNSNNISINISVNVPAMHAWTLTPYNQTNTTGLSNSGSLGTAYINNTGNIELNFTISYSGSFVGSAVDPGTNPTNITLHIGELYNFTPSHSGSPTPGTWTLNITFTNLSATPTSNFTIMNLEVVDQPPTISDQINASPGFISEANVQLRINFTVKDDQNLVDSNSVHCNFTLTSTQKVQASQIAGCQDCWKCQYTPTVGGKYNLSIFASDTGGKMSNASRNLTIIGKTSVLVTMNSTSVSVSGINQTTSKNVTITVYANNTGMGTAKYAIGFGQEPPNWVSSIWNYSSISNSTRKEGNITVTVPTGTEPGTYYTYIKVNWTNPDNSNSTNTSTSLLEISVLPNPLLTMQEDFSVYLEQGTNSSTLLYLNSTGNDPILSLNLTCRGTYCLTFNITFNESAVSTIPPGTLKTINVSIRVPRGQIAGPYPIPINATAVQSGAQTIMTIIVGSDYSWSVTPTSFNTSAVIGSSGATSFTIQNSGNEDLFFYFNLSGNITEVLSLETLSSEVIKLTNYTLNLTYSAPLSPGTYQGILTINETTNNTLTTIPLDFKAFSGFVSISPNKNVKQVNIRRGDTIYINATVTAAGSYINENVSFQAFVNGSSCPVSGYVNIPAQNLWMINCTAPSENDGLWHNLTIYANYSTLSIIIKNTTNDSIHYLDITPPAIVASSENVSGTNVSIELNVSDNINISTVSVYILQLSSNVTLNKSGQYTYRYNLSNLSIGDYDVIYWLNDTTGNSNYSTDYFEVWSDAAFSGDIKNSSNQPVVAIFNLYRNGTNQLLQNFSTNSSGQYRATIHDRLYDLNIYSSQVGLNLTINKINLVSYTDSFDFDKIQKRETNLVNGVNGVGLRSNITESATITISYNSEDLTTAEDYLKIYKCGNWNFSTKTCSGSWSQLTSVVDKVRDTVSANTTQLSDSDKEVAYVLGESQPTSGQPDISVSSPDTLTVHHNRTGTSSFSVVSSGTGTALGVNVICVSGTVCQMKETSMAPTYFESITEGSAQTVNINVSIPYAYPPGTYLAIINAYGEGINNKTVQLQVVVPSNASWNINQTYFNSTVGTGETAIGYFEIENKGNINFQLSSSTNNSIAYANETLLYLPKNQSSARVFKIIANATSPGNRTITITLSNSSARPQSLQLNVSLNVVNFTVTVLSPNSQNPESNITPETKINITARVYLEGTEVTSGVNWSVSVGGSSCPLANYSYLDKWEISCLAPSISTINNSLVVYAVYGEYSASDSKSNSIQYTDTVPPHINITAPSQYRGGIIPITIFVTDNAGVSNVSANITYPNGSVYGLPLTFSDPYYINNLDTSELNYGTYKISARANDTSGLTSTNTSAFNVLRGGYIAGNFTGPNATVHIVEIRLYDVEGNILFAFNSSGVFNKTVNATDIVNLELLAFGHKATINGVNISNNISNIFRIDEIYPTYVGRGALKAISITNISVNYTNGTVTMDYSGTNYVSESNVGLYKCSVWDFKTRTCTSGWERQTNVYVDRINHKISANISSFSAYAVAEYICGDGVCHSTYGESNALCPSDCPLPSQSTQVQVSGGSSTSYSTTTIQGASEQQLKEIRTEIEKLQSMQPGSEDFKKQVALIEELYKNLSSQLMAGANLSAHGMQTVTNSIYFELYPGEETTTSTTLRSTLDAETKVTIRVVGNVKPYVVPSVESLTIPPHGEADITLYVTLPPDAKPGVYYGSVEFENDVGGLIQVPFNLRILQEKDRLLDLKIQPVDNVVEPGGRLRIETNIYNLGEARRVDAQLKIQMIEQTTDKILTQIEEALAIETSLSSVKTVEVPGDAVEGKYILRAIATYPVSSGLSREAVSVSTVQVRRSLTPLLLFFVVLVLVGGGYVLWKRREREKKRFMVKIDFSKLPQFDERTAFIGKIAETNVRAGFPIDKLVMHTLIAGASGSGKTVAAQVIVEEVLKKKVAVIVFDPTAQWTGFLRKNTTKEMLDLYPQFGMSKSEATAFSGNIYLLKNPSQKINIREFMKQGEISVFTLAGFKSTDIETLVSNVIDQVFELKLDESKQLRLLIVFDEVHRLLPKFGGTGKGFTNIERAVREFRKWGVGMLLSSQVLSDFVGEIKTNISTEIQLRTKYEEDLNRIKMKYGEEILRYIVKSPVGTAMIQNAEFNRGNPYFVSFRPLLHSIVRLSDKALETYQKYNERISKIVETMEYLKSKEVDVFDAELELKLAKDKLNKGSFEVVEIYLDSLEKKLEQIKRKIG